MTANLSTLQAYIADVTKPEDRGRAMGMIGAAFGLGFILGPFFGGVLAAQSFRAPGFAAAALAAVNFALALRNLPESLHLRKTELPSGGDSATDASKPPSNYREGATDAPVAMEPFGLKVIGRVLARQATLAPLREAMADKAIAPLVLVFFLQTFAFTNLEATFALFTQARFNFGSRETGFLFGYIGLVVVIVQGGIYGRLSRKHGDLALARAGMLFVSAAMLCLVFVPSRPAAYASPPASAAEFVARALPLWFILPLSSVGNALINPSLSAATSKRGRADRQGRTLGVQQSTGAFARVLGPITAGFAFDHFGASAPMMVACVGALVAALLVGRVPPVTDPT